MGRAEKRAAARGKGPKQLAGFQFFLTPDEARLMEEALHSHTRVMLAELGPPETYSEVSRWAFERTEQLRRHFEAAVDGWDYQSPLGAREEPLGDDEQRRSPEQHAQEA